MAGIVDSGSTIVAGGAATFDNTITKDGATYSLAGKTVKATIRAEIASGTVIHSTLEDIAVTVDDAVNGGVTFTLTPTMSALLTGANGLGPGLTANYLLQYVVVEDDYYPQILRFRVREKLN